MIDFEKRLGEIYEETKRRLIELINETREKLRVKPKYIEPPDKYFEALMSDGLGVHSSTATTEMLEKISLKIKASTVLKLSTEANRELNRIYSDLKAIEEQLMKYVDEASREAQETVKNLWDKDLELNKKLRKAFEPWIKVEENRRYYTETVESLVNTLKQDYKEVINNIDELAIKVSGLLKELEDHIEAVKEETREHRKILLRYLNFAEGVRTKGVKLYLPVARIIIRDRMGSSKEIFKFYTGNLRATDKMIENARAELEGIDQDFIDALRKYVSVHYSGLQRYFLLRIIRSAEKR